MAEATVTTFHRVVNPEEKKMIGKVRRIARRHGLRLVKCRDKRFRFGGPGYQLQACVPVAGKEFDLELKDALAICVRLDGER